MDKMKFDAIFPIICSDIVKKIKKELNVDEETALKEFYSSRVYELLEKEETKFWQYSTEKLYEMLLEEKNNGKIDFPQI